MAAGRLNLFIEQGSTFTYTLTLNDESGVAVDLEGYTARMQMRRTVQSSDVLLELTTANGRIVLTPATGSITLEVDAVTTAALSFPSAVYDLEIESEGGQVTRLLQGGVTLSKEVTR
jgi:hypothetical protein